MWSRILALSLCCVTLESCGGARTPIQSESRKGEPVHGATRLSPAMQTLLLQAEKGDIEAQFTLGQAYDRGRGVPQNKAEAARWYQKAAERGDTFSQFYLGNIYWEGSEVTKSEKDAVRWWKMAAAQGFAPAQNSLGKVLETGTQFVRADKVEAYVWLALSAAQGDPEAELRRKSLAQQLRPSQLNVANKMVKSWRPQRSRAAVKRTSP
ncbi:tetratricopeptide repeat protein [Petrachloros mirabilis]